MTIDWNGTTTVKIQVSFDVVMTLRLLFEAALFLFLLMMTPLSASGGSDRDFCSELVDLVRFECPPAEICTKGLSDLQSHFSIYEREDWAGLGPEFLQLHYNRYPTTISSQLLNLLAFDAEAGRFLFGAPASASQPKRKLVSQPQGYTETMSDGDLRGEARVIFVGLDTILVSFRVVNDARRPRSVQPLLVGQFGDTPSPGTHFQPGGSRPSPNPLPPFPPGELGRGTAAWFEGKRSSLTLSRYMDLPRADSGRIALHLKLPEGWRAWIGTGSHEEWAALEGATPEIPRSRGRDWPAHYYLVGSALSLAPGESAKFAVLVSAGFLHHFGLNSLEELAARAEEFEPARQNPDRAWTDARARWNGFFSSLPRPRIEVPDGERLYLLSYYTLQRNLYAPDWNFRYPALLETKGWYDAVWQWSVAPFGQLALLPLNPQLAQQQTFLFTENALPNGMIPEHAYNTFVPTDTIHPQLLAYGAWLVYLRTRDHAFLERIYTPLARHFDWLYAGGFDASGNVRDKDRDGVFEWGIQAWDNGLDNDPRSDVGLEQFEAIDLNTYILLSVKVLARMAEEIGRPDEASRWKARASKLSKVLAEEFFDTTANVFWDRRYDSHARHDVLGFFNFLPLLAGVPLTPERRDRVIRDYLLSPHHFWGLLPFPSLSFSDPHYSPTDYMRGPVWPGPSFLLTMILWKNGFRHEADQAAQRFLEVVSRGKGIFENYDSQTGEPMYGKRVELISWNAACIVGFFLELYQVEDELP